MMQEIALGAGNPPVALDADLGAVGQAEAGDIDRQAECVLAEASCMIARAAAGIGPEMVDPADVFSEVAGRGLLDDGALEIVDPRPIIAGWLSATSMRLTRTAPSTRQRASGGLSATVR
jgi:hypothetical protein